MSLTDGQTDRQTNEILNAKAGKIINTCTILTSSCENHIQRDVFKHC